VVAVVTELELAAVGTVAFICVLAAMIAKAMED
jgi:hypothetical protein